MKIQHKRSSALEAGKAKEPTAPQTEYGELCVNFNHQDPSLFIKDSSDVIRKIGGDLDLYLLKEDAAASVIIGESAPTQRPNGEPLESGDLWYCSSTEAEGGGRLYVYYIDTDSSQWVDTSLPGVGSDFGQTEAERLFLKLDASNDPVTGTCEFAEGINVSGGTSATSNIYNDGTSLGFAYDADHKVDLYSWGGLYLNGTATYPQFAGGINFQQGVTSSNDVSGFQSRVQNINVPRYFGFRSQFVNGGTNNITDSVMGFLADNSDDIAPKNYGFYSALKPGANENYNFYAAGSAPNYFAGLTEHAGGVKVSGGTAADVSPGFIKDANAARGLITVVGDLTRSSGRIYAHTTQIVDSTIGGSPDDVVIHDASIASGLDMGFTTYVTGAQNLSGTVPFFVGYECESGGPSSIASAIGFKSEVNTNGALTRYNFYAAGTAPNYFRGDIINSADDSFNVDFNTNTNGQGWAARRPGIIAISRNNANAFSVRRLGSDGSVMALFDKNNNEVANITVNAAGAQIVPTSDYRVKSNIGDIESVTDLIKALKPRKYTIRGKDNQLGFIAHELQEHVPQAVYGDKDATEPIGTLLDWDGTELETDVVEPEELTYEEEVETDGVTQMVTRTRSWTQTGTRDVYQGVDQTKLIPLLTKALQEVMQKNEDLEARIAALEGA